MRFRNIIDIFRSLLLPLCVIAGFLLTMPVSAKETAPKKLLIINSYSDGAQWSQKLMSQILSHLSTLDVVVQTDIIHLNNLLIHDAEQYEQMEEGLFSRYPKDNAPDYTILLGNMAFSLRDKIERNWGKIPMILVAQNDKYGPQDFYYTYTDTIYPFQASDLQPLEPLQRRYNFTLVHVPNLYKETVDMMLFMFPNMKKIVFLADDIYLNHALNAEIEKYILTTHPNVEYEWLMGNRYNAGNMRDYLSNMDFNIGLLLSTWFYERTSVHGLPMLVSDEIRMIYGSRRPVFSLRSVYLDLGVTGGYFPSPEEVVKNLNSAINKMLAGADMNSIPFYYCEDQLPIVNYSQLKKTGLSEDICPPGTEFINKPESFWETNSMLIIGSAIGIIALLSLMIGYSVFQRKKISMLNSQKQLVSSMPIAYTEATITYDSNGNMTNVEYHHSNEAFHHLLHDNRSNSETRRIFYRDNISSFVGRMIETGKPVRMSYYFKQSDRYYEIILAISEKPATRKPKSLNIHLFAIDVTDKSKAENALRDFARKLDVTLNVARIIPWRWDLVSGKISCEIQRILHHGGAASVPAKSQLINIIDEKEYFANIHPDDLDKVRTKYEQLISGKVLYTKVEFRQYVMKRGKPHIEWIEVNASINARDEDGRPTGILGSMLIITQRKLQEEQLIKARAQALESDRLKSAFLANMSHEIRTPLNAIVGFSNLLTKTPDHAKRDKFISIIENNNELLLQLISDVLDLSKVESNTLDFKMGPCDINELMTSIEGTVRLRLQPGVALNLMLGSPDCTIVTDRKRLSQVLINMITNSCKFTSKGNITFGYELRDEEIYFFVKDTGIGISKDDIPKLFHRFVKLDTFVQGTGLGLSISKHIIEKLGGKIGADSAGKGKGSLFWFTLPNKAADKPKLPATPLPAPKKEEIKREELTILIAEDNKSNYMLFQSILEKDYRLIHAWDGSEAVKLYDQFRPALILMDINMPVMDGYEATHQIRKLSSTVPIIAVTAYAYSSDQDKILENGFNGYLSKPVNQEKLTHEIASMLHNHFMLI